ncbi:hypothetical protein Scep_007614 [Stephania cephalantha]|uniref:Uncharacterized protein n=1 Tax=Stephania cephalantha TaxID=152367 RepID=A0AAP0KAE7_9MAGN
MSLLCHSRQSTGATLGPMASACEQRSMQKKEIGGVAEDDDDESGNEIDWDDDGDGGGDSDGDDDESGHERDQRQNMSVADL